MTQLDPINEELIEATYWFCYKRLQNSADSEDLTHDILYEAIRALKSDKEIVCFNSWYWAMAKNKFNMYLRLKQYKAVSLNDLDIEAYDSYEPDDIEISKLNYAISRLSSINRQIIIMYYLKETKISEISEALSVPEGTIKRRLFDAKKEIKKELDNMTNYGKTSYAPSDLQLWGCYSIPQYWDKISDIMTKQIFAICANEAKTIREIADEIGVAPVYFEEKLIYLLENKFIKETLKGKYIADFVIYPLQVWYDFSLKVSEIYSDIGKEITDILKSSENEIRSFDFYGNNFDFSRLLWILYHEAADVLSKSMLEIYKGKWISKVPENNGKRYRLAGTVLYPNEKLVERESKNHSLSWSNIHYHFKTSGYSHVDYANLFQAEPFGDRDKIINEANADLFMRIFDDPDIRLTYTEEETVANLIRLGYLFKKEGRLYPSMPVISNKCKSDIKDIIDRGVRGLAFKYVETIAEAGEKYLLPVTRKDLLEEYAHYIMQLAFFPIGYLFNYGLNRSDVLEKPSDPAHSSLGICIYYNK